MLLTRTRDETALGEDLQYFSSLKHLTCFHSSWIVCHVSDNSDSVLDMATEVAQVKSSSSESDSISNSLRHFSSCSWTVFRTHWENSILSVMLGAMAEEELRLVIEELMLSPFMSLSSINLFFFFFFPLNTETNWKKRDGWLHKVVSWEPLSCFIPPSCHVNPSTSSLCGVIQVTQPFSFGFLLC